MSTEQHNEQFDSTNLLVFLLKWKKQLIIVCGLAAVISAGVSLIIPEKFESTYVFFPAFSSSISKGVYWGELDYMLIDLPPGTGDVHLSIVQAVPLSGAIVVSTPQQVALADARKGINMFQLDSINVPVLGLVENMSYFTPEELPDNKYYIFGKDGAKELSEKMNTPLLGQIPLVQSIRESGDIGRPAVLQDNTVSSKAFEDLVEQVIKTMDNK